MKKEVEGLEGGCFPISVIVPISHEAKLHAGSKIISIEVSQVIFFGPDLTHGGASYDRINTRFLES